MNNRSIIISLIIFLLLSFGFLAWTENKQQSPASQNWWVVSFSNPKDNSLDFVIENNSNDTAFQYEILEDKNSIKKDTVEIAKGTKKEIPVTIENTEDKKITIRVSAGSDRKEIYKSF